MDYDPIKLEAFLDLLVQSGVEEFEGFGMHIRFTSAMFTPDKVVKDSGEPVVEIHEREERPDPQSIWEDPSLWPGGKRPGFPTK